MTDWSAVPNERSVEVPWLLSANVTFPALDVGSHDSGYLRAFADAMTPLDGLDIRYQQRGGLGTFYQGDIRTWTGPQKYATVISISTLEHVGLRCEDYGSEADDPDGDRGALLGCVRNARAGGRVLFTVPYGEAGDFGWYRRYDDERLAALCEGLNWTAQYHSNPAWDVGGVALVTVYV